MGEKAEEIATTYETEEEQASEVVTNEEGQIVTQTSVDPVDNIINTSVTVGILAVALIIFFALKAKSAKKYEEYIAPLSEKEHKLKNYIPIGLYIDNELNILSKLPITLAQIIGKRQNDVRMMIIELNDAKYADYYFSIFQAEKKVISLLVIIAGGILGTLLCLQNDTSTGMGVAIFGIIFGIFSAFIMDSSLKGKIDDRHTLLRMEFPDFVNQLVLLINAGLTVSRAWEKIVNDNKKVSPLYDELKISLISMQNGTPEAYAIEAFGRRCKIKEIMKFTSVLISNLKKGGAEMVPVLIQQSNECWEMRKGAARDMGSKAGVKMMLPMIMLLAAILLVVGFPALMSFSAA
ncbi:MAG: type II secretion system F family protein [Firmicutes bacterium]|nr:type II secretion system F family protein [Bacillota bacterium]